MRSLAFVALLCCVMAAAVTATKGPAPRPEPLSASKTGVASVASAAADVKVTYHKAAGSDATLHVMEHAEAVGTKEAAPLPAPKGSIAAPTLPAHAPKYGEWTARFADVEAGRAKLQALGFELRAQHSDLLVFGAAGSGSGSASVQAMDVTSRLQALRAAGADVNEVQYMNMERK